MPSEQYEQVVALVRALPLHDAHTIPEQRAAMDSLTEGLAPPRGVEIESATLGGRPSEWITPADGPAPGVLVYLHGGAYCLGSLDTQRQLAARLARATGFRVVGLDYRLAPEHPFPAAVEDALAAYRELLDDQVPPQLVVVGGDSAGGGLAVAMLVAIREAGLPMPAAAFCLSPWADLTLTGESIATRGEVDPMLRLDPLRMCADAYLHGADPRNPLASPVFAELHDLPPLFVQVGDHELTLDDSVRLARAAETAGVEVTLEVWDEMFHVFQAYGDLLPEADAAVERLTDWLRDRIAA